MTVLLTFIQRAIIQGIPRFRFPDFSVKISPEAPYKIGIP